MTRSTPIRSLEVRIYVEGSIAFRHCDRHIRIVDFIGSKNLIRGGNTREVDLRRNLVAGERLNLNRLVKGDISLSVDANCSARIVVNLNLAVIRPCR
jgi:hypothetical protein